MKQMLTLPIFGLLLVCSSTKALDTNPAHSSNTNQFIDLTSSDNSKLIADYWIVLKQEHPRVPEVAYSKNLSGCVMLTVVVNKNGDTEFYKINKSYPEGLFEQALRDVLKNWKWAPAEKNPERAPVLTTFKFDFWVDGASNISEVEKQCGSLDPLRLRKES